MDYMGNRKPWDKFEPDSNQPSDVLSEVARHMEAGHQSAGNMGSVGFNAGHQLSHKGWKFPGGVYDVATNTTYPGIKGLRALILAGRHDWFQRAAWSTGVPAHASEIPDAATREFVSTVTQGGPFLSYEGGDHVILVVISGGAARVAGVVVKDASSSGLSPHLAAAVAAGPGCALPAALLTISSLLAFAWYVIPRITL
jgi:hypothetical protein